MPDLEEVKPTTNPDGLKDYGTIDQLTEKKLGQYMLIGDFGKVSINCKSMDFVVK